MFALTLDVGRARARVGALHAEARSGTLTAQRYKAVRAIVYAASSSWQLALKVLATVALYNAIGMTIYLSHKHSDSIRDNVLYDMLVVAIMVSFRVKESGVGCTLNNHHSTNLTRARRRFCCCSWPLW